jgi:hypothetical protein
MLASVVELEPELQGAKLLDEAGAIIKFWLRYWLRLQIRHRNPIS